MIMTVIDNYDKINFKTTLTFSEYTNLVRELIDVTAKMCESQLYGSTSFAFDVVLIEELTDILTNELPTEEMWKFVTETPIMEDIKKNLGAMYYRIIADVQTFTEYNRSAESKFNEIFKSANKLVETINEKVKALDTDEITTVFKNYMSTAFTDKEGS